MHLVPLVHAVDLFHVAKAARVVRDDGGQRGWDAVGGDDVVPRQVLDLLQLVARGEVAHGQDLELVLAALWHVNEHVSEVARALGVLHGGFYLLLIALLHVAASVEDVAHMRAVFVILAAEQGGVLIEQHRLDCAEVAGDAVDGLGHVVVPQVQHFAGLELRDFSRQAQLAIVVRTLHPAHVDGGQVAQSYHLAHPVADDLRVGVGEGDEVRHHGVHGFAR